MINKKLSENLEDPMTRTKETTRGGRLVPHGWFTTLVLGASLTIPSALPAQQNAGSVTALTGQANVKGPVHPAVTALKVRDDVHRGDQISTPAQSLVRLRLGSSTIVTVRELSMMTLKDDPSRVRMEVGSGALGLTVLRQSMSAGNAFEINTPHAVASVRGTLVIAEVPGASTVKHYCARNGSECFHVLKGAIEVRGLTEDPSQAVRVGESEGISVIDGKLGRVVRMSDQVIADLRGWFREEYDEKEASSPSPSQ
jgi:hypothetical protein